jgi:hypothetical protein
MAQEPTLEYDALKVVYRDSTCLVGVLKKIEGIQKE